MIGLSVDHWTVRLLPNDILHMTVLETWIEDRDAIYERTTAEEIVHTYKESSNMFLKMPIGHAAQGTEERRRDWTAAESNL